MEVEAAKSVQYRRLMLRAVQLSSEVYSSCGGEGLRCSVLYQLRPLNFQYPYRVKPLEILMYFSLRIIFQVGRQGLHYCTCLQDAGHWSGSLTEPVLWHHLKKTTSCLSFFELLTFFLWINTTGCTLASTLIYNMGKVYIFSCSSVDIFT